jgi:beta-xylosidase
MKNHMNKARIFIFLGVISALVSCRGNRGQSQQDETRTNSELLEDSELTYTNPIIDKYLADPCLMYDNGYYYLFATGRAEDGRFIPIHRTKDFVNWEFVRGAVERGGKIDWNYNHFWAPEVIKIDGRWHLYYTATPEHSPKNSGNRVGLAVSDSIQGPYEDRGVVIPHGSIDGHVFIDEDGRMYMFYTIEYLNSDGLTAGQIYMDRLIAPDRVAGNPKQIISYHKWQEGPFLQHRFNKYFLTYSSGAWTNATYHVRYAIASSPEGPFTEQPDTILSSNEMVKGPGHHFMYQDKHGKDWIIYHGWDTAFTARYPRIDRICFSENSIRSDGPTFTEQKLER